MIDFEIKRKKKNYAIKLAEKAINMVAVFSTFLIKVHNLDRYVDIELFPIYVYLCITLYVILETKLPFFIYYITISMIFIICCPYILDVPNFFFFL